MHVFGRREGGGGIHIYIYTRLLNRVLPPGCVWYVCDKGEEGFGWRMRGFLGCI